jgi:16S rRNA (uracil1498-N3)-methyltransferase
MISLPLFFQENIPFVSGEVFCLNEEASKHIIQVLRMEKGQQIQLTDGKGSLASVEISDPNKKKCGVKILSSHQIEKPKRSVVIAISLIKNSHRFEWFLEKVTELGITGIVPLICNRTEKQHFRHERMKGILMSAMLQSKQVWLPDLKEPTSFASFLKTNSGKSKYLAHCMEEDNKIKISSLAKNDSCVLAIGPEGDFTPEEVELAKQENFISVSLGETRLRTETAGVAAAVLLQL